MKKVIDLEILKVSSLESQFNEEIEKETKQNLLAYFNSSKEPKLKEIFIFEYNHIFYHFMLVTVELPGKDKMKLKFLLIEIRKEHQQLKKLNDVIHLSSSHSKRPLPEY